jgi:hypothetical protein
MIASRILAARSSLVWSHSPEPPVGISGDGEAYGATAGACEDPSVGESFGDGNQFPVGSEAGA